MNDKRNKFRNRKLHNSMLTDEWFSKICKNNHCVVKYCLHNLWQTDKDKRHMFHQRRKDKCVYLLIILFPFFCASQIPLFHTRCLFFHRKSKKSQRNVRVSMLLWYVKFCMTKCVTNVEKKIQWEEWQVERNSASYYQSFPIFLFFYSKH